VINPFSFNFVNVAIEELISAIFSLERTLLFLDREDENSEAIIKLLILILSLNC